MYKPYISGPFSSYQAATIQSPTQLYSPFLVVCLVCAGIVCFPFRGVDSLGDSHGESQGDKIGIGPGPSTVQCKKLQNTQFVIACYRCSQLFYSFLQLLYSFLQRFIAFYSFVIVFYSCFIILQFFIAFYICL